MSKNQNRPHWMLVLGLTAGIAATLTHAADKDSVLDADAKASEQEDTDAVTDHAKGIKGSGSRIFSGAFAALSETSQDLGPDVVGSFTTDSADKKPGRTYLVKVQDKGVLKTLARYDGKKAKVVGKLRVIDTDGEAKYLIVSSVIVSAAPTPSVTNRNPPGGL